MVKRPPMLDRFCRYLWLILILIAGSFPAMAQAVAERNTVQLLDTEAIKNLMLRYNEIRLKDKKAAIDVLEQILTRSEAARYNKGVAIALSRLGSEYQSAGEHQKALDYMFRALPIAELPESIGISNILYNNIGLSYSAIGSYALALKYYNKALEVVTRARIKNATDSIGLYNNVGILWARLDEITYALQTFKWAEKIVLAHKDTLQAPMTYLNIATCYELLGRLDMAERYYRMALAIAVDKKLYRDQRSVLAGLSAIYRSKKQYTLALDYLNRALAIRDTSYMTIYEQLSEREALGEIYLEMGNIDKAKPLLLSAFFEAERIHHEELLEDIEPLMAKLYAAMGRYDEAYKHMQHYNQVKDTMLKQEKKRSVKIWIDVMMAEKNKEMLSQKLYIAQQNNKLQQKNFWIAGTTIGALLLLSLSFAWLRIYRHKQQMQQTVIQQLQQTQEINQLKALVRGEEQERQRIAHELHDDVAGQLWAIKINVDNLQQDAAVDNVHNKALDMVAHQLADVTQDIRKTAHNLLPDLLLQEGLVTAIASVCEKTAKNTGLEVDFQEYGIVPRIDRDIELSIYRMVQELVQNVLKHAKKASCLLVQLGCAGTLLNITIEDNGEGFKPKEKEDGIGLQQIKIRTAALKGHFDIQSVPGKGTTAYLEFDLQHFL